MEIWANFTLEKELNRYKLIWISFYVNQPTN
jgi:hypothetical protein